MACHKPFIIDNEHPHRPSQTSASTVADIRVDRCRHPRRPLQTSASTVAHDAQDYFDIPSLFVAVGLFVMVALALDDSAGAIQLLGEYQSHHLMRECHSRERNLLVGALVHGVGETIRSADDENKSAGSLLLFLKPSSHLHTCALRSVFVEQNNRV